MKKQQTALRNLVLAGMFLAIGFVLPFLTGQIQQIGNMLLPMHIPVLLCGLICGWKYGLAVGFTLPLLRSLIFGMPPIYPTAFAMAFELATYGFLVGFLFARARWQCLLSLYRCLVLAMLGGRAVWGFVRMMTALIDIPALSGGSFSFSLFLSGAFLEAIPGIILQLILIPSIMLALDRTHLVPFRRASRSVCEQA